MAGSVNKVILVGNLGRDPDTRTFQNGGKVCNLSVATSESWKDRNSGERKERVEWHHVKIFNEGLADVADRYLRKGSKVYLEGQLQTRKYQAQDGSDRFTTEIVLQGFGGKMVLLGDPPGGDRGGSNRGDAGRDSTRGDAGGGGFSQGGFGDDLDDDMPF